MLFAALIGWGLIRYMQDEVLHSQLLLFPRVLQPLKGILGEHSLIFSQPDLEQLSVRNLDSVIAQWITLGLDGTQKGVEVSEMKNGNY